MEQGRNNPVPADPGASTRRCKTGATPDPPPNTCTLFPPLIICEKAHRDKTGRPLCLGSHAFPEAKIQHHLEIDGCPVCQRWYDNACREYARLAPAIRSARLIRLGATRKGEAYHELPRLDDDSGLNPLPLLLRWHADKDDSPQHPAWWMQLKAHAARGHKSRLNRYNGRLIVLTVERTDGGAPVSVETRLGFDSECNLVSTEKVVPIDPRGDLNVTLLLRPRPGKTKSDDDTTPLS